MVRRSIVLALLGVAVVAALVWYATRPERVKVNVATAELGRVEASVTNTRAGTVKARRRARLAPATGGQIAKLPVHEGDRVKQADLLLELWNDDLAAGVLLAERDVLAARARIDEVCARAEVAASEAERLVSLRNRKIASEEDTERAIGEAKATRAACEAARAAVEVAEAQVAVARANLERTRLYAPFDGVIADINGEVGEFVTPSPVGIPTLPSVDLIDTTDLYVSAPIDEVDAGGVRVGMPARISIDAFPARTFPGKVARIASYVLDVEKQARTVELEVEFAERESLPPLLAGYSADVEVILAEREKALRVPTESLLAGNRLLVYDASDDGRLVERAIEPGLASWQFTEVRSGLSEGDRVVTSLDRAGVQAGAYVEAEETTPPARATARRAAQAASREREDEASAPPGGTPALATR